MNKYSEIEEADAQRINEIGSIILEQKNNWDKLFNDLINVFSHIPIVDYLNNFEENDRYYFKFWDQEELYLIVII